MVVRPNNYIELGGPIRLQITTISHQIWRPGGTLHVSVSPPENPVLVDGYDISINTPGNVTVRYRFDGDLDSIRPRTPRLAP